MENKKQKNSRKVWKVLLPLCLFALLPLTAGAQKFALVDMEYILKNVPAYERANEQLNQVSKKWQAEVEALNTEASTMYKNYQNEVSRRKPSRRPSCRRRRKPVTSSASILVPKANSIKSALHL